MRHSLTAGNLQQVLANMNYRAETYEARIVNAPIENGIIITAIGEIYHCTGDLNTLNSIIELGKKLEVSYITHNPPIGSVNEYTFGGDDKVFFTKYKPVCLRGIDEKFMS